MYGDKFELYNLYLTVAMNQMPECGNSFTTGNPAPLNWRLFGTNKWPSLVETIL